MQLGVAATIAVRYSSVRRQGSDDSSSPSTPPSMESQILDYQTQQYRLLPQVANTFAFLWAATQLKDLYLSVSEQLLDGQTDRLASLHALSAGLKAVVSWEVAKGIEQCRLACGGHGYSNASGLPELYAYAVGGCTYEGENIVLLLQVARQLIKGRGGANEGKKQMSILTRLEEADGPTLVAIFERAAAEQIAYCARSPASSAASVELCKASKLHVLAYLVKNFFEQLEKIPPTDKQCLLVLKDLGRLFALWHMSQSPSSFIGAVAGGGSSSPSSSAAEGAQSLRRSLYALLSRLRPNAVALVDSFDFSDRELNSALGRRDGHVYEAMLSWAKASPLNKEEVSDAYTKYLKPMMEEGRSKL